MKVVAAIFAGLLSSAAASPDCAQCRNQLFNDLAKCKTAQSHAAYVACRDSANRRAKKCVESVGPVSACQIYLVPTEPSGAAQPGTPAAARG